MHVLLAVVLFLTDAQQRALEHAPDVRAAQATVEERSALYAAARAGGAPHAFVNYAQSPQAGNDNTTVEQRITTIGAAFNLTDVASASPLSLQAAADLRSAQAALRAAQRNERTKTIGLYTDYLRTREVFRLRALLLTYAQADESAARKRFTAGDVPRLDVVRASVASEKARADLAAARADYANASFALSLETGVTQADLQLPQFDVLRGSYPPLGNVDAAVTRALASRGEVTGAKADVSSEEAAIIAARKAAAPALTAQIGYAGGLDTGIAVHGPAATLNVDFPLSSQAQDRVQAEEARLREAQARYESAQRAVALEVSAALQNYAAQRDASAATARARAEAQQEVQATQTGYRNGASSSLDVIDARRTFAQAAIDDITAQAALFESAATLSLNLGDTP